MVPSLYMSGATNDRVPTMRLLLLVLLAGSACRTIGPENGGTLRLGRHELVLPEGCANVSVTKEETVLRCGDDAQLRYSIIEPDEHLDALVAANLRDQKKRGNGKLDETLPCAIGGVATTCRATDFDGTMRVVIGAAVIESVPTLAICAQPLAQAGAHKVCAPVVTF